jgi:phospholipid N-methyltransferase
MKCFCCQAEDQNKIILSGTSSGERNVYLCSNCDHIFRDYSYVDLDKYYNEQYRRTLEGTKLAEKEILLKRDGRLIDLIKPWIQEDDKILELGSGDGNFASLLKDQVENIDITCCEKDKDLSRVCEEKGHKVINEDFFDISTTVCDTFAGFDVLEHILDLQRFIKQIKNLKFKKIILQVPIKRGIHNKITFDGHFHYFSEKSMRALFHEYKALFIYETARGETKNGQEMIAIFARQGDE